MKKLVKRLLNKIIGRRFLLRIKPDIRTSLARRYLSGCGIELGALHLPLLLPRGAHVKYVDRMSVKELRKQYPELKKYPLVDVDIIDDGETLEKVKSDSLDFVIANHFLEHCENPIRAIESFLRVLKKGGIIYLTVPDKRATFDSKRPITQLEHIVKDYEQGPNWSRKEHFYEWTTFVNKKAGDELKKHVEKLIHDKYRIHFHVWTYLELFKLIIYLRQKLNFGFEVKKFV